MRFIHMKLSCTLELHKFGTMFKGAGRFLRQRAAAGQANLS